MNAVAKLPRIVFAGTPEFAATALKALLDAGFEVSLVLTQPDRPAGRGMQLQPSPVKRLALAHGIEVFQPVSLKKDLDAVEKLGITPHEVMVVAAYGLILPSRVLLIPLHGCINIHASLLPRWRGAAPIHRAIEAGDTETGVCIMGMEAGLDTGPVYLRSALPIAPDDTTATLHDKLAELGGRLIVAALPRIVAAALHAEPQPAEGVTYAQKIGKPEATLDLNRSAAPLARQIRAFDPFPGATLSWKGTPVKVFQPEVLEEPQLARLFDDPACSANIGAILQADARGVVVRCGDGAIVLKALQKPGGKRLPAREFLQGVKMQVGEHFDLPT